MEQDEKVICTISKDSNHKCNQALKTQKKEEKDCYNQR